MNRLLIILLISALNILIGCGSSKNSIEFDKTRNKKSEGFSTQTIKGKRVNPNNESDFNRLLTGKVPGLQINDSSSSMFDSTEIRIRGEINVLYIVDGVKMSANDINTSLIKSIKVIKGPHAVTRYGNEAINGVILISTR
tara:strand:- start:671 stop:1090 length:420 start_codon:yes stop_codon:yes gene_type:complete